MNVADVREEVTTLDDYLRGLRRRRGMLGLVFALILLLTLAVTLGIPPVYRSTATILIEQQEIPQDLVRSTVSSYADQRIQVISQRVMTSANLAEVIRKYDLYREERERGSLEAVIADMREKDIKLELVSADVVDPRSGRAVQATIAFQLSYANRNPDLAQKVANELVSLFLNENLKSRTAVAEESLSFLSLESDKLSGRVAEMERQLAEFKERHAGKLPELANINIGLLDRTENQVIEARRVLASLEDRRIMLQGQLGQLKPTLETLPAGGRQAFVSPSDRLRTLETEYLNLLSRYSAEHPDVVRARREMEGLAAELVGKDARDALRAQRERVAGELGVAERRYSAEHPDVKRLRREVESLDAQIRDAGVTPVDIPALSVADSANPAYVQLESQLRSTEFEIATTRKKIDELEARIADYESRLSAAPEVEREYRGLMRDYELAVAKYREVTAKQMEAQLASSLESEQKGERFALIEPPLRPEDPASPNRPAIAFLGLVFALAGGLGTAAFAEALDSAVYGSRGVARVLGAPPLAVIPRIDTALDRRRRLLRRVLAAAAALAAVVTLALAFHFTVRPLDVLFFQLLHAVGL